MSYIDRISKYKYFLSFGFFVLAGILLFKFVALANITSVLVPIEDGTYQSWSVSTSTLHYTMVDETPCNGNTDYVYTSATTSRDSYKINLSNISTSSVITDISITPCASRINTTGGTTTMNVFYRFSGNNSADSGDYKLSGTVPTTLSTTTFSGLTFIKTSTSTLEIGAVYTSGGGGVKMSNINTSITYTPAPSNLTAVSTSTATTTSVILRWNDNSSNEDGFKIERSSNNVTFSQIGTASSNITSYTDYNMPNTAYYRVRSYKGSANTGYTNTAVVYAE